MNQANLPLDQQGAPKRSRQGFTFYLIWIFIGSSVLFPLFGVLLFYYYSTHLPDFKPLKEQNPNAYSIVYSEEDEVVAKFLPENRIPTLYEKIPKSLVLAFIAAEDADFFKHRGIDYKGIVRAMMKNLIAGKIVQGGSTITQQVTKAFFLTPQRSLLRKLKEVAYAFSLERTLTKEEILYLYLNNIYLGNGAYGVAAASESYFNKRIEQLNLAEIALLAGLVKAPSRYSPVNNLKRAKDRQAYVLTRMVEVGFISPEEKEKALQTPLKVQSRENAYFSKAPYFTEFIRQQIESKYGKEVLYQGGIRIYTRLNLSLQRAAQQAIGTGLAELDKRQGFRGPLRTLSDDELKELEKKKSSTDPLSLNELLEGVVLSKDEKKKFFSVWVEDRKGILPFSEMSWALQVKQTPNFKPAKVKTASDLLKVGDVIYVRVKEAPKKEQPPMLVLDQDPLVQGALFCLDPRTGHVKAMVGGRSFSDSQFNRAIYSRRQPGSAFKPMIYAAALEKGYQPSTLLLDSPVEYPGHDDGAYWAPKNYDKDFMGPITFRNALAHSRNVVTIKILEDIGIGFALQFIKRLGIESPIRRDLSIALGTSGVSMPELAGAFGAFANGGERVKPIFIEKIVTMKGEVLEENFPYVEMEEREGEEINGENPPQPPPMSRERVLSPQLAFLMTHLLEGVVQHGTGQRAQVLERPIAGKTGTSSDYADAWFIGYTPSLLASVWVGFDNKTSLGQNETGARAALPIWISFMEQALKNGPIEHFNVPPGITLMRVNLETGLPSHDGSQETIMEAFVDDNLPEDDAGSGEEKPHFEGPSVEELPKHSIDGP
ncbi:MAG: PBP1A family penicillin-binding protein [Desulfobacterales bacterium]|nr:PBP1A family penicillin-binding protein [Desulfobacterales bacterium]